MARRAGLYLACEFEGIKRLAGSFEPLLGGAVDVLAGQQTVTGRGRFVVSTLHFAP